MTNDKSFDFIEFALYGRRKLNNVLKKCRKELSIPDALELNVINRLWSAKDSKKYLMYATAGANSVWSLKIYKQIAPYYGEKTKTINILDNTLWEYSFTDFTPEVVNTAIKSVKAKCRRIFRKFRINGIFVIQFGLTSWIYSSGKYEVKIAAHVHGWSKDFKNWEKIKSIFSGGGESESVLVKDCPTPRNWLAYAGRFSYKQDKKYLKKTGGSVKYEEYINRVVFVRLLWALSDITLPRLTFAIGNRGNKALRHARKGTLRYRKEARLIIEQADIKSLLGIR